MVTFRTTPRDQQVDDAAGTHVAGPAEMVGTLFNRGLIPDGFLSRSRRNDDGPRVKFYPRAFVKMTLGLCEMTDEEIRSVWSTADDFTRSQRETAKALVFIRRITYDEKKDSPTSPPQKDGEENFCLRGLEHMGSADSFCERKDVRRRAVQAVLEVQEELRELRSMMNVDQRARAIAIASRSVTTVSRENALRLAASDEAEVLGPSSTTLGAMSSRCNNSSSSSSPRGCPQKGRSWTTGATTRSKSITRYCGTETKSESRLSDCSGGSSPSSVLPRSVSGDARRRPHRRSYTKELSLSSSSTKAQEATSRRSSMLRSIRQFSPHYSNDGEHEDGDGSSQSRCGPSSHSSSSPSATILNKKDLGPQRRTKIPEPMARISMASLA